MAEIPAATEDKEDERFFVTRESQEASVRSSRKDSYAGLRDLSDLEKIKELDIVGPDGTIRGIKNRVRAGLATYENHGALVKKNNEEGKIVVYTTSFRGVRRTYEDCRYILTVFHNLRVRVQERDIYVHKFYHRELEERLGSEQDKQLPVPQVYINGQHIGSKSDIEMLNESGELRKLVANLPRQDTLVKCGTCAGFEFIPCRKCGGSKNSVANNFTSEFRALRCTHCNENGMEPCPICEKKKLLTVEEKEALEAAKKEKAVQKQVEKEQRDKEKRDRIMMEALEAEREKKLEKEKLKKEKEKKKERARLEKERKKRAVEIKQKVVADIAKELEREKQWQAEHEIEPEEEVTQDSENTLPTTQSQEDEVEPDEVTQDSENTFPTLEPTTPQEHKVEAQTSQEHEVEAQPPQEHDVEAQPPQEQNVEVQTPQESPDNDKDKETECVTVEESETEGEQTLQPTITLTEQTTELCENETETLF